jgi:branched-chain amino acid transport system substrate-binding protein
MLTARTRTRSRAGALLAVVGLVALSVVAAGDDDDSGGSDGSVKVGFMGDLTGENKQLGINIRNGAKLAIDQYNAGSPERTIELVEYDTQGDPTQATNVVPRVVSDGVVAVIGPAFSGESKQAVPGLDENGIPNISASATNAELGQNGWKTWHRVLANDSVQGPGVAQYMAKQLEAKKVAVIDDQSEYGKGLGDTVASALSDGGGVDVSVREAIDPAQDNYSSTVNKIKGADVDQVFYAGYYAQAGTFVKQIRDAGVDATFISADGSLDPKFIEGGGQAAEGAYLSCTCVLATASDDPEVQSFIDDYEAAFGALPGTYSSEGYDSATAFVKAVEDGKTEKADILEFVNGIDFEGVSKPIAFEPNGELSGGSVYMHLVRDGKIVALGDYQDAPTE